MYYGFDIGGTKIALGVFDSTRRLQWEKRVPTPHTSYSAFLGAIAGRGSRPAIWRKRVGRDWHTRYAGNRRRHAVRRECPGSQR